MTIHPRQVLSAFGWSFVQSWGSQLTKLGVFIVLARLLDPRDIGLVAFAMVFIQGAQSFALSGVSDALIQKKDLTQETMSAVFWLNMFIAGVLATVLFIAAPLLQTWFEMDGLASVLRWVCPALLLQGLAAVQIAQFRRNLQMRPVAVRELLASFLGGMAGVVAALQGWGVYALVVAALVGQFLGTLFLWWSSKWRPDLALRPGELRGLLGFALNRTGSSSLIFLTKRIDDLFIGLFLGPVALGYYSVAYRILQALNSTATAVTSRAAFPLFSRLQSNKTELRNSFIQVTRVSVAISFGLFGVLFFTAPQIIAALFGEQWMPSSLAMRILCVAGVATNMLNLNRLLLRAAGRADWEFRTLIAQAVLCSIGFYFAAQNSIEAVAVVAAFVSAIMVPLVVFLNRAVTDISWGCYIKNILGPSCALLAAGMVTWAVKPLLLLQGWSGLFIFGLVFLVVYILASSWAIRRDLAHLRSIVGLRVSDNSSIALKEGPQKHVINTV